MAGRRTFTTQGQQHLPGPVGYVLGSVTSTTTETRPCSRALSTVAEICAELRLNGRKSEMKKPIVMMLYSDSIDVSISETLQEAGGIDRAFLAAHAAKKAYRSPVSLPGARRTWCWIFPEVAQGVRESMGAADAQSRLPVVFCRTSLWLSSSIPVVLVDRAPFPMLPNREFNIEHHELTSSSRHAHTADQRPPEWTGTGRGAIRDGTAWKSLSECLEDALVGSVSVEETLAETVYEQWTQWLNLVALDAKTRRRDLAVIWKAVVALEQNVDEAQYLSRHGQFVDAAGAVAAWRGLLNRLYARIRLFDLGPCAQTQSMLFAGTEKNANGRSLDRISYLGGVLLPVTVVAGILSIGGNYGPSGGQFWIFWVASIAASAAASLVIYADQLRYLEVWFELPADEVAEDEAEMASIATDLVQIEEDGGKARTWRRRQLGWGGAVRKMAGYYRWRGDSRMQFQNPLTAARGAARTLPRSATA